MAKQIEAGLKIKAGVEGAETLRQLADEIEAMGGDTAQLREQSKSLGEAWQRVAAQQALIARFRELKTESRGLADELAATQANINTLAQRMQADPSAALRRQFDAATQKAARLKDKQSELQQSLQRVRNEMRAAELPTRNLHQEQARLGEAAKAAEAKLHGLTVEAQRLKSTAAARVRLGLDVDDRVRREITATTAAYRTLRSSGTLTKQQLARATELYKARLRELKAELDGVPGKMSPIASSLKGLGTAGLAAAGVGGGLYAVKEGVQAILDKTQEFQQIRKRLDYAFGGAEEGGKQLDFVRGVVERLGLDMVSAANGYAQLAAATKDLNISHAQTQQIFSGVANAVAAMNLSADEANGVFLALSQIAGKGKVSMEELRGQLGERLSPAMAIAAKSMGVTTAELEKMVESGISAEEFLPKFGAALEQAFAADAARNVETLNGQINLLKNRFAELLNGFGEGGVADAVVSVLQDVGGMLDWLEEKINGMDATVSGGLKDTFVSAYDAIKEGAVAVYDLFDTVLDVINSIGGGIATLAGGSAEDFDFIRGLINSVNIALGVLRDGISAIGIGIDLMAGAAIQGAALISEAMSKITFGEVSEQYKRAAEEMTAAAEKHYAAAEQAAMEFESKTAEAIRKGAETEQDRYQRLEQEARAAYQSAADAAIKAAEDARSAQDKANAAIGTAAEQMATKQAQEANRAAGAAAAAAQKAEDEWLKAFVNIGGETEVAAKITAPLRDAGLAAQTTAQDVGQVSKALADAKGAASGLGLDLRAAMSEPTPAMQSMLGNLDKLRGGWQEMQESGINAASLVRQAMSGMLKTAANEADLQAVKQQFARLGQEGRLSMQEVEQGIIDADLRLQELKGTVDPVTAAFKRLGIQTKESLTLAARNMQSAFETAKASGQASTETLNNAFKRAADAALASGDAQMAAWVRSNAALYGYRLEMDNTGKTSLQLAQTVESSANRQTSAINRSAAAAKQQSEAMSSTAQAAQQASGGLKTYKAVTFDILSANLHTAESAQKLRDALKEVRGAAIQPFAGANAAWRQRIAMIKDYEQSLRGAKAMTEQLNAKVEAGTVTLEDLSVATGHAAGEFAKLDNTTLSGLNSAIDKARDKIQALQDEAASTRAALEAELAELSGDTSKKAELEQENKLRELNLKLAEAERAQNSKAVAEYRQAVELQERLYQAKQQQAEAERIRKAEEAAAKEEAKAAPAAPVQQQVLQIGEARVSLDGTQEAARQLADALRGRDDVLVDKAIKTLLQRLHDEIKRSQ